MYTTHTHVLTNDTMDYVKIITWLLGWAIGIIVMGLLTRMVVSLFCYGYGC